MRLTYTVEGATVSGMATLTTTHAAAELRDRLATLGVGCEIVPSETGVQANFTDREVFALVDRLGRVASAGTDNPGQLTLF